MAVTLNLDPEMHAQLQRLAQQQGISLDVLLLKMIEEGMTRKEELARSVSEASLLEQINLGISDEQWRRYHLLRGKKEEEMISSPELQELVELQDQIESANVKRIAAVARLAQMRNTSLPLLMEELGLLAPTYG